MNRDFIVGKLKIKQELKKNRSRSNLLNFIQYVKPDYHTEWFHRKVCHYLDLLETGKIKKLMVFLPPQHGKSEISSRMFPAYLLGRNPKSKIALCSYGHILATGFNRNIQTYMDNDQYHELFPKTMLNSERSDTDAKRGVIRNTEMFETVKHRGFVKTVGVGGGLTGTAVDIGIIDDPFKDRQTANSEAIRESTWGWYNDVFLTRLHNDSKILMLFTRWHEDDLAGRILDPENEHYDAEEAKEWIVVAIPALKEEEKPLPMAVDIGDPREIDEALWPERHSAEKYFKRRRNNPIGFASLDQQRPKALGGNLIKTDWLEIIGANELPFNPDTKSSHFVIDGAYTEKQENDETGLIAYYKHSGKIYIVNCTGVRKEMNELLNYFPNYALSNGYKPSSYVRVEPKASGQSLISMLKQPQYGSLNAISVRNKWVGLGKMLRVENSLPALESGKVVLIRGEWNKRFLNQLEAFPNGTHDDMVDCLTYSVHEEFIAGLTSTGVTYLP